jgi:hypothetical protein
MNDGGNKMAKETRYPQWMFFPRWAEIPNWVGILETVFRKHEPEINSIKVHKTSDEVLSIIRKSLEEIGFTVEGGEEESTIKRPVHFGEFGLPSLEYHIDSYHKEDKIALEIEAGRTTRGNAIYRDIIQTSLLVGVRYFALAVPLRYPFQSGGRKIEDNTYEDCKSIINAIFSTPRFKLPFDGVLLMGY